MAATLECWSARTSADDDLLEQVLVKSRSRSEPSSPSTSFKEPSKWQRLGRNFAGAINSLKNTLLLDSVRDQEESLWCNAVESLMKSHPGSQIPEKLACNLRKHFDSLPISYARAGFDMNEVFLHMRLIEKSTLEDMPAISVQEISEILHEGFLMRLTFACNSLIPLEAIAGALDSSTICCKRIQIFERKFVTLGIMLILVQSGQVESLKARVEAALRSVVKRPKTASIKLPFGLCGCQEESTKTHLDIDEEKNTEKNQNRAPRCYPLQLELPLSHSTFVLSVDAWQNIQQGGEMVAKWLISPDLLEVTDCMGETSFRGVYKGKNVAVRKLRGCEKGSAYEIAFRHDLLQLMTCGHWNILYLYGVCIHDKFGFCVVTELLDGSTVHDMIHRGKKIPKKDIVRVGIDVAQGLMFMNDNGIPCKDLNTHKILLDRQGNACIGDINAVSVHPSDEVHEYETAGYQWLAPEIIAGDPEMVTETCMSNVYSYAMLLWEMIAGEVAYGAYSPVQAAVGIAACGLRPEIPEDCPNFLKSLMLRCWNSCPSKRPQFSEILTILQQGGR